MARLEELQVVERQTHTPNAVPTKRNLPRIRTYFKDYLNSNSTRVA